MHINSYYNNTCICYPEFNTSETNEVKVTVVNDSKVPIVVVSRSYGAWGCNQVYGNIKNVCFGKAIDPISKGPGYNQFVFDNRGHCKGFAIQSPALPDPTKGDWFFYTLKPEQLNSTVNVIDMIKNSTPNPIGPLGCWYDRPWA